MLRDGIIRASVISEQCCSLNHFTKDLNVETKVVKLRLIIESEIQED